MPEVDLFIPCLTDTFHPRAALATVAVLEHLGVEVNFPSDQTCCGQAHHNAGCAGDARTLVRRMSRVFTGDRPVVTPSGSCAAMIVEHASGLFAVNDPDAVLVQSLADRTREFSQYLLDDLQLDPRELGAKWPGSSSRSLPTPVTWHFSCHLRSLGGTDETLRLLAGISGLAVVPLPGAERCCGFGGAFAVDEHAISASLGRDKGNAVRITGAEILVCNDSGCALQIAGTLSRMGKPLRVAHIAEPLAEALGLAIPGEAP